MISADYYIVQVQVFGELLEYRYNDYAKARHLMEVEALPCSLWACYRSTGERVQLENRMTRWACSAEPVVKRPDLWYNQSGGLEGLLSLVCGVWTCRTSSRARASLHPSRV